MFALFALINSNYSYNIFRTFEKYNYFLCVLNSILELSDRDSNRYHFNRIVQFYGRKSKNNICCAEEHHLDIHR